MSFTFREGEWLPGNSDSDDWLHRNDAVQTMPLGCCRAFGLNDEGLFFDAFGKGDAEWMRHVFVTLKETGLPFLAGIYRCLDKNDPQGEPVLQFCVSLSSADADAVMPTILRAYDETERITQGQ